MPEPTSSPTTTNSAASLTDEQYLAIWRRDRRDLVERMTPDQLTRFVRVVRRHKSGPGAGTREESKRRAEILRAAGPIQDTRPGLLGQTGQQVANWPGQATVGLLEGFSDRERSRASGEMAGFLNKQEQERVSAASPEGQAMGPAKRQPSFLERAAMAKIDFGAKMQAVSDFAMRVAPKIPDALHTAFQAVAVPGSPQSRVVGQVIYDLGREIIKADLEYRAEIGRDPRTAFREHHIMASLAVADPALAALGARAATTRALQAISSRMRGSATLRAATVAADAAEAAVAVPKTVLEAAKGVAESGDTAGAAVFGRAAERTGDHLADLEREARSVGDDVLGNQIRDQRIELEKARDTTTAEVGKEIERQAATRAAAPPTAPLAETIVRLTGDLEAVRRDTLAQIARLDGMIHRRSGQVDPSILATRIKAVSMLQSIDRQIASVRPPPPRAPGLGQAQRWIPTPQAAPPPPRAPGLGQAQRWIPTPQAAPPPAVPMAQPPAPTREGFMAGERVRYGRTIPYVLDVQVTEGGDRTYTLSKTRTGRGKASIRSGVPESELKPADITVRRGHRRSPPMPGGYGDTLGGDISNPQAFRDYIAAHGGIWERHDMELGSSFNSKLRETDMQPGLLNKSGGTVEDWGERFSEVGLFHGDQSEAAEWLRDNLTAATSRSEQLGGSSRLMEALPASLVAKAEEHGVKGAVDKIESVFGSPTTGAMPSDVPLTRIFKPREGQVFIANRSAVGVADETGDIPDVFRIERKGRDLVVRDDDVEILLSDVPTVRLVGKIEGSVMKGHGTLKEAGFSLTALQLEIATRMASSALGAVIGATSLEEQTGRKSVPGAVMGGLAGLIFGSPRNFQIGKRGPVNFEQNIQDILKALPDRYFRIGKIGEVGRAASTAVGVLGGGLVGSTTREGETSVGGGIAGAILGGIIGSRAGRSLDLPGGMSINPRRALERLLLESRGLTPEQVLFKRKLLAEKDGLVARITDAFNVLRKAPESLHDTIHAFTEGKIKASAVPEPYRNAAIEARFLFDELGVGIVTSGMAGPAATKTIMSNLGKYLPRLYLGHEIDEIETMARYMAQHGDSVGRITANPAYLMHQQNLPPLVREAMGQIKNVAYLLGKRGVMTAADLTARRWMNFLASSPDYTLPDGLTKQILLWSKRGQAALPSGTKIRTFREAGHEWIEYGGRRYRKVADTPGLGPIRGRYVDEASAGDLDVMHEGTKGLARLMVDRSTAIFKASKVSWNPASLMRNIYGQIPLNDMAGVPPWRLDVIVPALADYKNGTQLYKEARASGLFGGGFHPTEVAEILRSTTRNKTYLGAMNDWVGWAADQSLGRMERIHEASDHANKMILYRYARQNRGMSAADAVQFSKRWVFDYREVPNWIRLVRKSPFGSPFISFSYKALPRVLESAMALGNPRQFMAFWKYPMVIMAGANEYSARKLGVQDPDGVLPTIKRMAKSGLNLAVGRSPENMRNLTMFLPDYTGAQQILWRYRDGFDRLQLNDMTFALPWGDAGEIGKGAVGQALARMNIPFPRQLEPSHPIMQAMVAGMTGGKDVFTGRDIIPPGSTGMNAVIEGARWLVRSYAPSWFPNAGFGAEKLAKAFSGNVQDPDVPTRKSAVLSELLGLRKRPVEPHTSGRFRMMDMRKEALGIQSRIDRMKIQGASKGRIDAAEEEKARVIARIREMSGVIRDAPPIPQALQRAIAEQGERRRKALEKARAK